MLDDVITKSEGKLLFIGNPNQDLESPVLFFKQNAQVDELKCLDINAFLLNFYLMYPPKTQTQSTRANREIHSVLHKFSNFNGNYKEVIDTQIQVLVIVRNGELKIICINITELC